MTRNTRMTTIAGAARSTARWPALLALAGLTACSGSGGPHPSGTLEATIVDVAPLIGGRVLEVRADEGDTVSRGDTLIVLDTDLIRLERDRAAARRATIAAQRAQARDQLKLASRRLELASTTLSRIQALADQGSASRQQLDEAKTKRDIASDEVSSARNQLSVLQAQEEELAASLAVYARQLEYGVVVAPSNGTVLVRNLEDGEVAAAGATGLRIADLESLDLRVYLEAPDLDRVELGQRMPVLIDAMPGEKMEGTVSWISSEAEFTPKNAQTRNARAQLVYAVKLRVANPDGRLHVGMPAEAVLPDQGKD
jgi:HlyD family secretion protein